VISQKLLGFTLLGAGWVLWLLVGLSVLSVAVALERGTYFFRRRIGSKFPELMQLCHAGNLAAAAKLALGESLEAEVVRTAEAAAPSNNAPFIGLFGTVLGIIRAFADLSIAGRAGAAAVMGGISEALVATAVGLFVAIPAVLAFNFFQRLVRRSVGRANALRSAIAAGMSQAQPTRLSGGEES